MTTVALESKPPTPAGRLAGAMLSTRASDHPTKGSMWAVEVAVLPARTLFELPLSPALRFELPRFELPRSELPGLPSVVLFTADPETRDPDAEPTEGAVRFDAQEWRALVTATEADRLWPEDLAAFCRRKLSDPDFRVELAHAIDGGQPDPSEAWNVSRVLTRWGAERLSVDLVS